MIIEISIAVIAVAFVAFVIFAITMLKTLRQTLYQVNKTMVDLRRHFDELIPQAQKAIEHTNQVSFDIKKKVESLNPFFNSLSNIGEVLDHRTSHIKKEALASIRVFDSDSLAIDREHRPHGQINVADIFELAGIGIRLWQKIKHKH